MKKASILLCVIPLLGFVGSASATSPMPEEVMPGQTATICTTHIVYITDREKGIRAEEPSSTFTFETSMPKKEVLEKIYKHMSDKLTEGTVSEFKIECRFPK
jgi:hypothetical protein